VLEKKGREERMRRKRDDEKRMSEEKETVWKVEVTERK